MHTSRSAFLLFSLSISSSIADFLGPTYPAPIDLTSDDSLVPAAWAKISSTFDAYLQNGTDPSKTTDLTGAGNVTFSTGLFSLYDPALSELQYHYTAPETANSKHGTNKVDGDSIYHVASVSKLFTVFLGMIELTDEEWNRPLTEIIPALAGGPTSHHPEENPLDAVDWSTITPWALANQQAGVPTNGIPVADSLFELTLTAAASNISITALEAEAGFPPKVFSDLGPCTDLTNPQDPSCPTDELIATVRTLHANFLPWTSPAYSNFGLMMLGLSISTITGKSFDELYGDSIFEPLDMSSSSVSAPTDESERARSVIAGDPAINFDYPIEFTYPSGGLLSTTNDLAKFGVGLLNSTLLTPEQTRKWMKPHTHSASLTYSVGAPWEIVRYLHPDTGKVTDLYTKTGDSGAYGGIEVLIPDYGAGFSLLNAYTDAGVRSPAALNLINVIAEGILPALEAQAVAEARANFIGEYTSADSNLNSSIEVTFDDSTVKGAAPSLTISSWTSNGTDMLAGERYRMLPTILKQHEGSGKVAFQGSIRPQSDTYAATGLGPFSGLYDSNFDWLTIDQIRYAGNGVQLFVFDVDAEGYAKNVTTAGTFATLQRK